ncbi:hypothetical protein GOBAR_DD29502 [Gossypium barbadense]|nr:hypothetical protein GOBAR_DD29502 [Gossypium barbadense]
MSKYELKPSIWPGNTKDIPRGWTTPVGGNKLRIGVPDKIGFEAYLKVEQDPYTKESTEALALLPFVVPHKLIPFPIGSNVGTYNKLLYHVKNQKFNAAVGDITILANRSQTGVPPVQRRAKNGGFAAKPTPAHQPQQRQQRMNCEVTKHQGPRTLRIRVCQYGKKIRNEWFLPQLRAAVGQKMPWEIEAIWQLNGVVRDSVFPC